MKIFADIQSRTIIPIMSDITGIVGRNDVGKSTLLEALEIFFNNHAVKCDGGDLSVGATTKMIKIGCVFDELPSSVVVDDTVETNFADEYLVNGDGDLEIVKTFKCAAKIGPVEIALRARHPSAEGVENLLGLKLDDLKTLGEKLGVASEVSDARKNSLWRAAIWKSVSDLKLEPREIDISKLDSKAKSIYEKIQAILPTFALFKSDRESSDDDGEAVTTHVLALAGLLPMDSVLFIQKVNDAPSVSTGSEDVFKDIVATLGILPQRELAGAKAIVLVEGRGDIVFLRHTARTLKANGSVSHDFDDKKIVPIPTGSCNNLNHWVTMKTADEIGLPWGAFLDSDDDGTNPECAQKNAAVVAQLVASGKTARLTRKRETENYLAIAVIHANCGTPATAALTYTDQCDAKKIINAATSVRTTHVIEKFWPLMTASDMLAMDGYTDSNGKKCHELVEIVQEFNALC